jgi:hypothetical protein
LPLYESAIASASSFRENSKPCNFGLLQHNLPCVDGSELARKKLHIAFAGRCGHVFGLFARFHGSKGAGPYDGLRLLASGMASFMAATLKPHRLKEAAQGLVPSRLAPSVAANHATQLTNA